MMDERERNQGKANRDMEASSWRAAREIGRERLHEEVERCFTYHPPRGTQAQRYEHLRHEARRLAHLIVDLVPGGREREQALEALETAVMRANAGIARREVWRQVDQDPVWQMQGDGDSRPMASADAADAAHYAAEAPPTGVKREVAERLRVLQGQVAAVTRMLQSLD